MEKKHKICNICGEIIFYNESDVEIGYEENGGEYNEGEIYLRCYKCGNIICNK